MSLVISNNVSALIAQNNLTRTSTALNRSLERLSSGFKVNRGADGPAALVISEQQRAQIAGLTTAIDNSEKGVAMVQTAEGAFNEINSLLIRIRGLALDSANSGINDANTLAANQAEISNALDTIDRIANNTQFGSKKILDGTASFNATASSTFLTDLNATSTTSIGAFSITTITQAGQKGQVDAEQNAGSATRLNNTTNLTATEVLTITPSGGGAVGVTLAAGSTNTQARDAINAVTGQTGVVATLSATTGNLVLTSKTFGSNFTVVSDTADAAGQTGIGNSALDTSTGAAGLITLEGQNFVGVVTGPSAATLSVTASGNVATATSGEFNGLSFTVAADSGNAAITSASVLNSTITVADGSLTFQIGANAGQTATLSIAKSSTDALGKNVVNNSFANLKSIDVTTPAGPTDALGVIDKAIDEITTLRGTLGAFQQNTLESTANNLRSTLENTVNAESLIRDTDFAEEIANFTKQQVLVQAGTSVLGNANQLPQLVLSLLQ